MERSDLAGLTITSAEGHVATLGGAPQESVAAKAGGDLQVQWAYRDRMMLTALPKGLTKAQVTSALAERMAVIDAEVDLAELVGEVL